MLALFISIPMNTASQAISFKIVSAMEKYQNPAILLFNSYTKMFRMRLIREAKHLFTTGEVYLIHWNRISENHRPWFKDIVFILVFFLKLT